jgi:hypothetical protein
MFSRSIGISVALAGVCFCGCDKEETYESVSSIEISQTAPESTTVPATTSAAAPAAPAAHSAASPEDQVIDAATEAPIRARAAELNAIRPLELTRRKIGEEVVVLVRGRLNDGGVYGSGPYTLDSTIRRTAIHAGVLKDGELGLVRVKIFEHPGDHPSVERNGVRPNKWGKYHASYSVEPIDPATPTTAPAR